MLSTKKDQEEDTGNEKENKMPEIGYSASWDTNDLDKTNTWANIDG